MALDNFAINTAKQFGDIPFVDFTRDLVTNTFAAVLDAHVIQMREYASLVNSMGASLSDYINNTIDSVGLDEIKDFMTAAPIDEAERTKMLEVIQKGYEYKAAQINGPQSEEQKLQALSGSANTTPGAGSVLSTITSSFSPAAQTLTAIAGMLNSSALTGLVNKIPQKDDDVKTWLNKVESVESMRADLNANWIRGGTAVLPNYSLVYQSIAATIASNKYALIQNMIRMGLLRMVVTEGEIETRITFESHETHEIGTESSTMDRERNMGLSGQAGAKGGGIFSIFGGKKSASGGLNYGGSLSVNTTKSWQRDTSGSRVDIYGRVLLRFKTDYSPLG